MVSPSCIPYSTIEMPDVEMSHDEVSDEILKDLDDEPIMKIKVFDSEDSFTKDINTIVVGIDPFSLLLLVFLSTLHPSPSHKKITNCSVDTKRPKEPRVTNITVELIRTEHSTSHFLIDPRCPILFALFPYL